MPEKSTDSWWLYHPFESGPRLAAADGVGAVESYASANAPLMMLPALSRQVPGNDAVAESGPEYTPPEQRSIPETASVPVKVTETERLYHPFASGDRAAVPAGTLGSVLSIFRVAVDDAVPP